jgi:hypothetical protein
MNAHFILPPALQQIKLMFKIIWNENILLSIHKGVKWLFILSCLQSIRWHLCRSFQMIGLEWIRSSILLCRFWNCVHCRGKTYFCLRLIKNLLNSKKARFSIPHFTCFIHAYDSFPTIWILRSNHIIYFIRYRDISNEDLEKK